MNIIHWIGRKLGLKRYSWRPLKINWTELMLLSLPEAELRPLVSELFRDFDKQLRGKPRES